MSEFLFILCVAIIFLIGTALVLAANSRVFLYIGETVSYDGKRYIVLEKLECGMVKITRADRDGKTITVHYRKLKPASWAVK